MKTTSLLAALAAAGTAAAHATFQQLWVNGEDQGTSCARIPASNSPVENVSSTNMRCNVGSARAASVCEVPAGATLSVEMHAQPNDRDCGKEAIGGNHFGPVMVYLSKVNDAASADGSTPWFKIGEFGYDPQRKKWGTDLLNDNCGQFDVVVPSSIPAGDYLLRAEALALHVAGQRGGAQFYMSCYQLRISGGGNSLPSGVSIPGAYSANDPGILINIWMDDISNYVIPGPPVVRA